MLHSAIPLLSVLLSLSPASSAGLTTSLAAFTSLKAALAWSMSGSLDLEVLGVAGLLLALSSLSVPGEAPGLTAGLQPPKNQPENMPPLLKPIKNNNQ